MPIFNKKVLMSNANYFSNDAAINPYYKLETIDKKTAQSEHDLIKQSLIMAGIEVVDTEAPVDCQDGVYTANWALVRGNQAVLARLPNARTGEEEHAAAALTSLGKKVHRLPAGLRFSGQGDALPCGDLLFCGSNYRSDIEAQKIAAEILDYTRIQLRTIPKLDENSCPVINQSSGWADSFFYDIDLALAIIRPPVDDKKGIIAYCPAAFTPESQQILAELNAIEKIEVSIDEAKIAFATNLVSTGETVVMSAHAPKLSADLKALGLEIITPEISELAKGGGYIRCVTLTID